MMYDLKYTENCLVKRIHEESHYDVWIVKMPDMDIETYGVVNRETGVIENLQPNIFNARALAYQFSKWMDGSQEAEIDVAAVLRKATDAPTH